MISTRSPALAFVLLAGCAAPRAPAAPNAAPLLAGKAYFVGVWTRSAESYDAALRSSEAIRLAIDGTLERGSWDARLGFTAAPEAGPSRGFVARWEVDAAAKAITFFLDGAEERPALTVDGPDRWKTVAVTAEGTFVIHHRKRP